MSTVNVNKIAERLGTNPINVRDIANKMVLAGTDGASKIGFGASTVADELLKLKDTVTVQENERLVICRTYHPKANSA